MDIGMPAGCGNGKRGYLVGSGLLGASAVLVWWTGDPFALSLVGVYLMVMGAGRTREAAGSGPKSMIGVSANHRMGEALVVVALIVLTAGLLFLIAWIE